MVVNTQSVHLDVLLDEVERNGKVWFKICLILELKVGIRIKMEDLTIILCELNLISNLI